jgi:hypothetical protein
MEIVWIYFGFSDAIANSIVWISLFFSSRGDLRTSLTPLYVFITRCMPIANVIRNAKNSALYDLIVMYGDLCWNIFIEENVISAFLAVQNFLISCPYCYIVYVMVYK